MKKIFLIAILALLLSVTAWSQEKQTEEETQEQQEEVRQTEQTQQQEQTQEVEQKEDNQQEKVEQAENAGDTTENDKKAKEKENAEVEKLQEAQKGGIPTYIRPNQTPEASAPAEPEPTPTPGGLSVTVGNIAIPTPFIHAGKEYGQGVYFMELINRNGEKWFKISEGKSKQFLFEEMAVVKNSKKTQKSGALQIHKQLLKGAEYFRVSVGMDSERVMAFFLVKPAPTEQETKTEPETPLSTASVSN